MARLNDTVEAALIEYADLLSILTDDPYKPRSYEKAARAVGGYPDDLATMDLKEILKIPSVGKSIGEKIDEFVRTGSFEALDELRAQIPPGVREMTAIPGLGPKKAILLYRDLGIADVEQLAQAVEQGRLAEVKGFGAKTEENIRRGIERMSQSTGRVLVSVAMDLADHFIERLGARKDVRRIEFAGSLRRMAETIGDLDLLVASDDAAGVMEAFTTVGMTERVLAKGDTKSSILTRKGLQVDLRVVPLEAWGAAMIYFTGSKAHNIRIREMAVRKGLKLNEYGLYRAKSGKLIVAETEEEVYEKLSLPWIPPTLREDRGEVEAALEGTLPDVLVRTQLRGDLHTHTNLTDGLASLDQMVAAASELRYAYYAVTDHAPNLFMQRMTDEKMLAQREQLRELQSSYPKMTLLHGTELNIDAEGNVDWDAGLPRGVRRLRRVGALALQPAEGRDDAADRPSDGEPARPRDRSPDRPDDQQAPAGRGGPRGGVQGGGAHGDGARGERVPGPARPAGRAHPVGAAPRREVRGRHRLPRDHAPRAHAVRRRRPRSEGGSPRTT